MRNSSSSSGQVAPSFALLPGFGLDRFGDGAGEGDLLDDRSAVERLVLFEGREAFSGDAVAAGLVETLYTWW